MNALVVLILSGLGIAIGYGVYAKSIDRRIIQPDDSKATPATMYMDGVDFTPANRNVLFGYQFKSVAALGPILGPIVAVRWGWLPALLWVIFGTFFIGWVQDYASIVLGVREEGQSFGALSYRLVSPRARSILLIFIYAYLLLIMGAFGKTVGYDLMTKGAVPFGVLGAIGAGLLAGQLTYKMRRDIILTTVVTVIIAFVGILLAKQTFMTNIFEAINGTKDGATPATVFGSVTWPQFLWSLVTLILCGIGAILPIWRWAQPINYVAFWIVLVGIVGGTIGVIVWHPSISTADFPAFTTWNGTFDTTAGSLASFGPLWPLLFVTIACGAISGWHSLVSSSGTARQLEKEGDALFVGGGSMFLEMFVATLALLTAVVGVGGAKYVELVGAGARATVFANGLATFLNKIGLPVDYGLPYSMVFLTLMALTIMYLVVRFMRVASAEFLGDQIPALKNTTVGTVVALVLSGALLYTGFWDDVWVLFGGANQLMAALALLLISLWLMSKGKNYLWSFVPFIFMFITTIAALARTSYVVIDAALTAEGLSATDVFGKWFSGIIGILLIIAALVLAYDSIQAIQRYRAEMAAEAG
jgi:carbon starvation protein